MFSPKPPRPSVRVPRYGRMVRNGSSLRTASAFCAGVLATLAVGALAMVGTSAVSTLGIVDRAAVTPADPAATKPQPVTDDTGPAPALTRSAATSSQNTAPESTAGAETTGKAAAHDAASSKPATTAAVHTTPAPRTVERSKHVEEHHEQKSADRGKSPPAREQSSASEHAARAQSDEEQTRDTATSESESKAETKHTVSKKHSRHWAKRRAESPREAQVYVLPDGRRIIVRRPVDPDRNTRFSERNRDRFNAFDAAPQRAERGPFNFLFGPP